MKVALKDLQKALEALYGNSSADRQLIEESEGVKVELITPDMNEAICADMLLFSVEFTRKAEYAFGQRSDVVCRREVEVYLNSDKQDIRYTETTDRKIKV